jgi:hypothetical protein
MPLFGDGFEWQHWLKWTMAVDVDRQGIVAQTARRGPYDESATLRPLVDRAHARMPVGVVLADAECHGERHHQHSRHTLQAQRVIPAKRGANRRIQGILAQRRQFSPYDL